MLDPFILKTKQFGLPDEDLASLAGSFVSVYDVLPRVDIAVPGRPTGSVHILIEGWASKYSMMSDGRRQILAFHLPGDVCDLDQLFGPNATLGVAALSDCKVATLSIDWLDQARKSTPAIRDLLWSLFAREHRALTEQIMALGRRTSRQRIAYFLCDLLDRLQAIGLASDSGFRLPLTQNDMADALGLSTVHVNRTLQGLREDGLIEMRGRMLRIPRLLALRAASC